MASNVPEFITFFRETGMDENLVDDPLDPDVYRDSVFTTMEEKVFDLNIAIQQAKINSLFESAAANHTRRVPWPCDYGRQYKRPRYSTDSDRAFKLAETECNVPAEQDLLDMKAMISNIKRNPSLIYQAFDLPWTPADLAKEKPTSNNTTELPILANKFPPRLPFPTAG
jgi:hypothetical protein